MKKILKILLGCAISTEKNHKTAKRKVKNWKNHLKKAKKSNDVPAPKSLAVIHKGIEVITVINYNL